MILGYYGVERERYKQSLRSEDQRDTKPNDIGILRYKKKIGSRKEDVERRGGWRMLGYYNSE